MKKYLPIMLSVVTKKAAILEIMMIVLHNVLLAMVCSWPDVAASEDLAASEDVAASEDSPRKYQPWRLVDVKKFFSKPS